MNTVLLTWLDNWNRFVEIPFVPKKAGYAVHVLCGQNDWVRLNSHHDRFIERPGNSENYARLFYLAAQDVYGWIILCDEPFNKTGE